HDLVEGGVDLFAGEAQDRAVQVDVLPAGELRMEPGAQLQQRGDPAPGHHPPLGGAEDPGHDLQQRGLARAVRPDQAERPAFGNLDVHVLQRPELLGPDPELGHPLLQRRGALPVPAELLADALDLDGRPGQSSSAKSPLSLKKCRQNRYRSRTDPTATAPITIARNPMLVAGSWHAPCWNFTTCGGHTLP